MVQVGFGGFCELRDKPRMRGHKGCWGGQRRPWAGQQLGSSLTRLGVVGGDVLDKPHLH